MPIAERNVPPQTCAPRSPFRYRPHRTGSNAWLTTGSKALRMHFFWKRVLGTIPSLVGVVVVTFLLSHALPGDPAAYFAGPAANAASIAEVRARLGLDQSLPVQFLRYLGDLAHGNLGNSLTTGQPVVTDLVQRLPASLELTFFALIFAVALAIPMGVWA